MLKLSSADSAHVLQKRGILSATARWLRWHLPKRISAHRILSGSLRGRKIYTSWRDYPAAIAGITEPELLNWFAQQVRPGETWLDIGAHYGYTTIALADLVGPTGRIFAFEPMVATVGCLARTRFINKLDWVSVVPMALGAEPTLLMEELTTIRGMVDNTLQTSHKTTHGNQWKERILVAQLDWLWPLIASGNTAIHGIKIDVQGMELHVLRGMQKLLQVARPKLVVELHRGVDRAAVLGILTGLGYSRQATPIEPVPGEVTPQFLDDRSYAFLPATAV
jgi:FkbM family methyltransferase